jgi:propionate CoA-transferase
LLRSQEPRILPELLDSYSAMVADLSERYYASATRYTTSAFLRVKLADALRRQHLAPQIYATAGQACASLREATGG